MLSGTDACFVSMLDTMSYTNANDEPAHVEEGRSSPLSAGSGAGSVV